jgi:hypothetical protein
VKGLSMIKLPDKEKQSNKDHILQMQKWGLEMMKQYLLNRETKICVNDWVTEEILERLEGAK